MFMFSYSTCYNIVIIITFCVFELIINIKGVKTLSDGYHGLMYVPNVRRFKALEAPFE